MNAVLVVAGLAAVAAGVGALYAAKRLLPGLTVSEEARASLRLLVALFAGGLITAGAFVVLLGLLG